MFVLIVIIMLIFPSQKKGFFGDFVFQMNEFKTAPGFTSAPLTLTGDAQTKAQDNTVKWISEGTYFHYYFSHLNLTPKFIFVLSSVYFLFLVYICNILFCLLFIIFI